MQQCQFVVTVRPILIHSRRDCVIDVCDHWAHPAAFHAAAHSAIGVRAVRPRLLRATAGWPAARAAAFGCHAITTMAPSRRVGVRSVNCRAWRCRTARPTRSTPLLVASPRGARTNWLSRSTWARIRAGTRRRGASAADIGALLLAAKRARASATVRRWPAPSCQSRSHSTTTRRTPWRCGPPGRRRTMSICQRGAARRWRGRRKSKSRWSWRSSRTTRTSSHGGQGGRGSPPATATGVAASGGPAGGAAGRCAGSSALGWGSHWLTVTRGLPT